MTVQYNPAKTNRIFTLPDGEMGNDITPFWDITFRELKTILLEWLQGARSVWVFSFEGSFNSPMNPMTYEQCFTLESHEILIVPPENISVPFLHEAFLYGYPLCIFKTHYDDNFIKCAFERSILPHGERLRDSDFNMTELYNYFGEFIAVAAWTHLYRIEKNDLCQSK